MFRSLAPLLPRLRGFPFCVGAVARALAITDETPASTIRAPGRGLCANRAGSERAWRRDRLPDE